MVVGNSYLRRLKTFDSVTPLSLETRGPGVYNEPFLIEGNSILSTIFIESCDPGATLLVSYWDSTTGTEVGEEYHLVDHKLMSAAGNDRLTVTRIHNKPNLRATVTGGNIRFGVYITVVSSFASDLDSALQFDGDLVNILRDKGIPIVTWDKDSGLWHFLTSTNGRLQVDVPNVIQTTQQVINFRRYNQSLGVIPSDGIIKHIDYTVPTGKRLFWLSGFGISDTWVKWYIDIDSVRYLTERNAFDAPKVDLHLGSPIILSSGQRIEIYVENIHRNGSQADIETFFFGSLEDV